MQLLKILLLTLLLYGIASPQSYKIIESGIDYIKVEFNFGNTYKLKDTLIDGNKFQKIEGGQFSFRDPGQPWLPNYSVSLGIPHESNPQLSVLNYDQQTSNNVFIIPFPLFDPSFDEYDVNKFDETIYYSDAYFPKSPVQLDNDYLMRYSRIQPITVSPYQFNPVTRTLIFHSKITVLIKYNTSNENIKYSVSDSPTLEYLSSSVINFNQAKNWISKTVSKNQPLETSHWYDPNKNYYKIFVKNKGIYRLTFESLVQAGVPLGSGIPSDKLEVIGNGVPVPIDINDGRDSVFGPGDHFQFVGFPPPPTQYSRQNIYNLTNVYWFSYQSDTLSARYTSKNGFPQTWTRTLTSHKNKYYFEKDSLHEKLGYALDGKRDFWFWGKAYAQNGAAVFGFEQIFQSFPGYIVDSHYVTLRVNMHGITTSSFCFPDHKAEVYLTNQKVGEITWDGQTQATFEKKFYVSDDSIRIFPTGNTLTVWVRGNSCSSIDYDDIRVNWFEFEYWKSNSIGGNNFYLSNPSGYTGIIRYWLYNWNYPTMKIYIPSKGKMITNPQLLSDVYKSALFVDTTNTETEYFICSNDYFMTPDSVRQDNPSFLRSVNNGADYIIITHPNFTTVAQRLAQFRASNFPDTSITNPRIFIADVNQIYDEFTDGLLDPMALNSFVKYAYENWESPSPFYVVLFGDMSVDYRRVNSNSRPNFIPSIPFFTQQYGQAPSDNMIVAVSGVDINPDLAIGRISCETVDEANILVDKIINYPSDNSKEWRQRVLLMASGLNLADEQQFQFNDRSIELERDYLEPNGINTSKVFRYPSKPEHIPFQGDGTDIRLEYNRGNVLSNYYGHGGGSQWDLTFLDDDIDLLENDGRLSAVISVTCYTAHFDNQTVFGEHFNRVPGKGSILFFGSSGLTYWGVAQNMNRILFNIIFNERDFVFGRAVQKMKQRVSGAGLYGSQVALLTLLGDPVLKLNLPSKPDFNIKSADISIFPENPLVGDTVALKVNYRNYGLIFPNDSVSVEIFASSVDTSYNVVTLKRPSFGERDSVIIPWIPPKGGLFEITVKLNSTSVIPEEDYQDNVASAYFPIFNISEPNILDPIDGFAQSGNNLKFVFVDVGYYVNKNLAYFIEIDTTTNFDSPLINSGAIYPVDGLLKWTSPQLQNGSYFWRTRIFDFTNYGKWSPVRSFTIGIDTVDGYLAKARILKWFKSYNMVYNEGSEYLALNTKILPPKPSNKNFIEDLVFVNSVLDSVDLTSITTDGTYIYFGNLSYYAYDPIKNPQGKSRIYKIGTGFNGTTKGEYYGPFSDFYEPIKDHIFYHSDGYIYIPTGKAYWLKRINVSTGDTSSVFVPDGLLNKDNAKPVDGSFYLASDGNYVYNISLRDSLQNDKYILRTFDPSNGWTLVKPDFPLAGGSYNGFTGFFAAKGYLYPSEYFQSNYMRRIRSSDGFYEEEWISRQPFQSYYSWVYDWVNDRVYASVYRSSGFSPKLSVFYGTYVDANGWVTSDAVGPAYKWNNISYDLENPSSSGNFETMLLGQNKSSKKWDTLAVNIPSPYNLESVDPLKYIQLQMHFSLTDSSFSATDQMKLKNLNIDYSTLPEIHITNPMLKISPDSILQGFNTTVYFDAVNIGASDADSLQLLFYLNNSGSVFYSPQITVKGDTFKTVQHEFSTDTLIFTNNINVVGILKSPEYYTFNNITNKDFYIARDSINPKFSITFDGKEILDEDIISATPKIVIQLEDNSPLPIDTSYFSLIHNNLPLRFSRSDITYNYEPYPNSRFTINWNPNLPDGRHVLEVLAKDASGNFFDTTSYRKEFSVYNETDLTQVYNYPNPFKDDTYFTFELRGKELPEKLNVKVFSIAGRKIYEFDIPKELLQIGFNRHYWNGKDQDGDEIANGLYLYKVTLNSPDKVKTVTQKLAKVK
jgi:hypothetical protein